MQLRQLVHKDIKPDNVVLTHPVPKGNKHLLVFLIEQSVSIRFTSKRFFALNVKLSLLASRDARKLFRTFTTSSYDRS